MKGLVKALANLVVCFILGTGIASANTTDNQTDDLSPISLTGLPFRVVITQAGFQLPVGIHSGLVAVYKGQWVFIAGRTNGLHGFGSIAPFPPDKQNTSIYVVNPTTGASYSRSLSDPSSGLNQQQIDSLSVTSPEGYQEDATLYMAGGYGIDTASGTFNTKPTLTAINIPGIIQWVTQPTNSNFSVAKNIRQVNNAIFQITGGRMYKLGNMTQLVFGQNFAGVYSTSSNGEYSQQVRQFQVSNAGGFSVNIFASMPQNPDPNFRRRDLNVFPVLLNNNNILQHALVAYSGVFTVPGGIWTVPVIIDGINNPTMADPNLPTTFKQGMNNYTCATAGLYSRQYSSMYNIFFGGISYGFYSNGTFQTDSEIPFINQITTIQIDKNRNFTQYLMDTQYPTILSTGSNPGNQLLFGAGAYFIPSNISQYADKIINLDNIRSPTVIGYIVGGIQSTLANTNTQADSAASPYVFTVTLIPN